MVYYVDLSDPEEGVSLGAMIARGVNNCLECNKCLEFEGTGEDGHLCQDIDCNECSELCTCGHFKVDHYSVEEYGEPV